MVRMGEGKITQFSAFFTHRYLQHAGCGWHGDHGVRYNIYLDPAFHDLKVFAPFAHDVSLPAWKRGATRQKKE